MDEITHQAREHTSSLCLMSHILQNKSKICIFVIDDDENTLDSIRAEGKSKLIVHNLTLGNFQEYSGIYLPKDSVPLDLNSDRLL